MHNHSSYLEDVFTGADKFTQTVENVANVLKSQTFDYIVCRGISGIAVASAVAFVLKKHLIVVRKRGEDSHASYTVEGIPSDNKCSFVIVDDFVCSGRTVAHMLYEIENANRKAECTAVCSYKDGCRLQTIKELHNSSGQIKAVSEGDWAPGILGKDGQIRWGGYIKSKTHIEMGERWAS
jgi:orotate phosphoribosyltransferase-like protein